ncbi:LCP family protein, partial [Streptomyces sp. 12297]
DRPRWGVRLAAGLAMAVLGSGAVGHAVMTGLDTGIERVDPFKDMKNRPQAGHGLNFLLVGTDGRDKIDRDDKREYRLGGTPCHCTDTIMLVHVSADRERASVVSLPRDSYAEVPAHTEQSSGRHHGPHPVKLNAAYAEGGPNLTVRTVENMTRVKIDHYLEVDFTSFMKTVDAMGGVEICTAKAMRDSYTGLDLLPGTHKLTGGQALQYVRSRHIDGAADLGRMQRQQRFLAALVKQATTSGVLLNPVKFKEVSSTLLGSVRADKNFGSEQMLALGQAMREFTPSSSEFASVPIAAGGSRVPRLGSVVRWDGPKAARLFVAQRLEQPGRLRPVPAHHRTQPRHPGAARGDRHRRELRRRRGELPHRLPEREHLLRPEVLVGPHRPQQGRADLLELDRVEQHPAGRRLLDQRRQEALLALHPP